jgi:SAM-dependent methyltransferase
VTIQYPENFIERLHLIWGQGFLSPGGPDEVREIVRGIDLSSARVLDIGCGTGGPAIVLAKDTGATLVCIDVEPQIIEKAVRLADQAGVAGKIDFQLVEPGPLPFQDASFECVFSKDALIHFSDKTAIYKDILRVLKPGGRFAASDWLSGAGASQDPAFQEYLKLAHLSFAMATAQETAQVMRDAGFVQVETQDRNAWYADLATQEFAAIQGPLREQIIEVAGEVVYDNWVAVRRQQSAATRSGSLRPTHLRGIRPA